MECVEEKAKAPEVIDISDSGSDYGSEEEEEASGDSEWEDQGSSSKGQAKIKVGKVCPSTLCLLE